MAPTWIQLDEEVGCGRFLVFSVLWYWHSVSFHAVAAVTQPARAAAVVVAVEAEEATVQPALQGDGTGDISNFDAGVSHTRLFNTAGVYGFKCTIHPGMTGTLTVQ